MYEVTDAQLAQLDWLLVQLATAGSLSAELPVRDAIHAMFVASAHDAHLAGRDEKDTA